MLVHICFTFLLLLIVITWYLVNFVSIEQIIPPKFARLHLGTLARKCILRPTGTQDAWLVRTKQINDSLYFKRGWKKFAQHYSLGFGDLLVFRYKKDCEFHVDVFDKSCCLKELAVKSPHVGSQMDTTSKFPSKIINLWAYLYDKWICTSTICIMIIGSLKFSLKKTNFNASHFWKIGKKKKLQTKARPGKALEAKYPSCPCVMNTSYLHGRYLVRS